MDKEIAIFWFRRDLRLQDNVGLFNALNSKLPVLPLFIFDTEILEKLPKDDARVSFIYKTLQALDNNLKKINSSFLVQKGTPVAIWRALIKKYKIKKVFFNKDYEPYALQRDKEVIDLLLDHKIATYAFKDQVIFEKDEIVKDDGLPYTVYTPYKNKWLDHFTAQNYKLTIRDNVQFDSFLKITLDFPSLNIIGFEESSIEVKNYQLHAIDTYDKHRDFPAKDATSYLSPHLRFGTVSIRKMVEFAVTENEVFLSELIWREFFMQVLFHFPKVVTQNFREKYNGIQWRNNENDFKKWCEGKTGYPMVDAGMRQLNTTGYMHNRIRMVTASFLCKHLLIDWRWGEAYFAEKLLDYDLASNNGNWQWAAGTGCDAAPYFRIFNPESQLKKFDPDSKYVKKWLPELDKDYPKPMVDHKLARERALEAYKVGIES